MKLWLLAPRDEFMVITATDRGPWEPRYDCAYGFVVRAATEQDARRLAAEDSPGFEGRDAWLKNEYSTCVPLERKGDHEVVLRDYQAG